jgi:hypothetical protein
MQSDFVSVDAVKYEPDENIREFVVAMGSKYAEKFDMIRELFQSNRNIVFLNRFGQQKVLQAVFLALILASIATNVNTDTKDEFTQKIRRVAASLDLNYRDVAVISEYETDLVSLLWQRI